MKRIALGVILTTAAAVALSVFAVAQRGRVSRYAQAPDAVVDGLRFHHIGTTSGFIQIIDVATGHSAGTIILAPNSAPVFAIMPGYEERARAAYKKYSEGNARGSTQTAGAANNATPVSSSAGLTVDGIVGMLQAGISEDIIIEKNPPGRPVVQSERRRHDPAQEGRRERCLAESDGGGKAFHSR